jgi:hypothetical protein
VTGCGKIREPNSASQGHNTLRGYGMSIFTSKIKREVKWSKNQYLKKH